ncbi:poly(ADP-ribose) glycohydrolase [Balamuthia mandrillaris]
MGNRLGRSTPLLSEAEWHRYGGAHFVVLPCHVEHVEEPQPQEAVEGAVGQRRPPNWQAMVSVLKREITCPAELKQAFCDIKNGAEVKCRFFEDHYGIQPEAAADDEKHERRERFFRRTLPFIQSMALRLPELFPSPKAIPLLLPQVEASVSFTKEQIACLMASSFMCTLWAQPSWYSSHAFPDFALDSLYAYSGDASAAILQCIIHYFDRLCEDGIPLGTVSYTRRALQKDSKPDWPYSDKLVQKVTCHIEGFIEDCADSLHADFANQYIGGGVLRGGAVQEEILFAIKPECLPSMLVCARMDENETILLEGAERYSTCSGYAHSLAFHSDFRDLSPTDSRGHKGCPIIAMDAVVARGRGQWQEHFMLRDLNKAYCGCLPSPADAERDTLMPFATGNWGCGAFGGDKALKFFQQVMAASQAGREIYYFTFKEKYQGTPLHLLIAQFCDITAEHHVSLGDLFAVISKVGNEFLDSTDALPGNCFEELARRYGVAFCGKKKLTEESKKLDESEQRRTEEELEGEASVTREEP